MKTESEFAVTDVSAADVEAIELELREEAICICKSTPAWLQ